MKNIASCTLIIQFQTNFIQKTRPIMLLRYIHKITWYNDFFC